LHPERTAEERTDLRSLEGLEAHLLDVVASLEAQEEITAGQPT
jgi:hypothetical protein